MVKPLKLFILAGEPSGDRLGADLISRLRAHGTLAVTGIGGDDMQRLGLESLFPMADLAVMGVTDVIRRLPLLLWRLRQTANAILAARTDVVVLIDSQDFSKLLAKRLRRGGFAGRLLLYVAPTVWARAPERAAKLTPLFDEVLAVLPFEPAVMQRLGGPPTSYVGHPAIAEQRHGHARDAGTLILLPGSRDGELRRHLPLLRQVVAAHRDHSAITGFVLPTLPSLHDRLLVAVADWPALVQVVSARANRHAVYEQAVAAVAVSGTVTLELALARVPMVVSYLLDAHQAKVYRRAGSPAVSLPNIILDRAVVPEYVQASPDPRPLIDAVGNLLDSEKARQTQMNCFDELSSMMEQGEPDHVRQDPADRVLHHWRMLSAR